MKDASWLGTQDISGFKRPGSQGRKICVRVTEGSLLFLGNAAVNGQLAFRAK